MKEIINRIVHNSIESNLIYPSLQEYKRIVKIDKDFVEETLQMFFNVNRIHNKYIIKMPNGQLWYQFDGSTWLIEEISEIPDCVLSSFESAQEIAE